MAHDGSITDNQHPLDDLAYDWVSVVKSKAEALLAYQKYMQDAETANSPECTELLRQLYEDDARHLTEAKRHLSAVLEGRMGQEQQQSQSMGTQGQGQRTSSGGDGKAAQR
jgi:uncharacterized membrane protein YgcG